jgi:hypothetical protein
MSARPLSRVCPIPFDCTFDSDEDPIAVSAHFRSNGLLWTRVITVGGKAYGTQTGSAGHIFDPVPDLNSHFDDSTVHLFGWDAYPDQESIITIVKGTVNATTQEAECLVRWLSVPFAIRGYEFNYAHDGAYCGIVRWNGARDDFTPISTGHENPNGALATGDKLRLRIVGTSLTASRMANGTSTWVDVATATDSTWSTGNPGIGFWKDAGTSNSALAVTRFQANPILAAA